MNLNFKDSSDLFKKDASFYQIDPALVFLSKTPGRIVLVPVNYDDHLLEHHTTSGRVKISKLDLNIAFTNEVSSEKLWMPLEVVDGNTNYVCPNTGGAAGGSTGGAIFFICIAYLFFKNKDKIMNKVEGSLSMGNAGINHTDDGQEMVGENMDIN